jgi:hypothetical protein
VLDLHLLRLTQRLCGERRPTELAADRAVTYAHRHWGSSDRDFGVFAKTRPRANDFVFARTHDDGPEGRACEDTRRGARATNAVWRY